MYHINQSILDEAINFVAADLDEWGTRLLSILEEQEYSKEKEEKDLTNYIPA